MYTLVTDVSPSEQISGNLDAIKTIGMVVGLYDQKSFERVGRHFDIEEQRIQLKKWAGSSPKYKCKFVQHLSDVTSHRKIICGVNVASERFILGVGGKVYQQLSGEFPPHSSISKSGRKMMMLGGYKVDGVTVEKYEVSKDDLCVLGWMTEAIATFLAALDKINDEKVKLDVLVDRLPNEKGDGHVPG